MNDARRVDPLHGVTLKEMVEHLVERYGWDGLDAPQLDWGVDMTGLVSRCGGGRVAWGSIDGESC